jgi:hypothetical protein
VPLSSVDSLSLDDFQAAARLVADISGITTNAQSKEKMTHG